MKKKKYSRPQMVAYIVGGTYIAVAVIYLIIAIV